MHVPSLLAAQAAVTLAYAGLVRADSLACSGTPVVFEFTTTVTNVYTWTACPCCTDPATTDFNMGWGNWAAPITYAHAFSTASSQISSAPSSSPSKVAPFDPQGWQAWSASNSGSSTSRSSTFYDPRFSTSSPPWSEPSALTTVSGTGWQDGDVTGSTLSTSTITTTSSTTTSAIGSDSTSAGACDEIVTTLTDASTTTVATITPACSRAVGSQSKGKSTGKAN